MFDWLDVWLFNDITERPTLYVICIVIVILSVYDMITSPNEIKGVFVIPNELPILGHLAHIIDNPALVFLNWSKVYGQSIFQIRIGMNRVIVVNSFEDVYNLWSNHSCSNNSRPIHYTFHNLVSNYQNYTIGSTPASPTLKRKKKAIGQFMTRLSIEQFKSIINDNVTLTLRELLKIGLFDEVEMLKYFQNFVLRSSIMISYGIKLDFVQDQQLIDEIIYVENQIIKLRSSISCLQDSLPFLRILPSRAKSLRNRRDCYMKYLMENLNKQDDCIVGRLVDGNLTKEEVESICLTLVSAGLDNTPLNLNYLFNVLSFRMDLQNKAIQEILSFSNGDLVLAWEQSMSFNCNYVYALIVECLRYFTVLPLSLPRLTTKPITYKEKTIPPGTTLLMNAYSANHDSKQFKNPYDFNPQRWIDHGKLIINPFSLFQNHFTFGGGSRICSGVNLAMKEMYVITIRILLLFEIYSNEEYEMNPFITNSSPKGISFEPEPHCVILKPRYLPEFERIYDIINSNI